LVFIGLFSLVAGRAALDLSASDSAALGHHKVGVVTWIGTGSQRHSQTEHHPCHKSTMSVAYVYRMASDHRETIPLKMNGRIVHIRSPGTSSALYALSPAQGFTHRRTRPFILNLPGIDQRAGAARKCSN
jgi:hypothetical protein